MADQLLNPSFWRTCRVLANSMRLRILALVLQNGPLTVGRIMQACSLSEPQASHHLRLLQSRGLLSATRISRWVHYAAVPDPQVHQAAAFLKALQAAVRQEEPLDRQIRALTAFTHPRRILLARALAERPMNSNELAAGCQMSKPALYRHLAKLERRSMITRLDDNTFELMRPMHGFSRALLRLVLASAA